MRDRTWHTILRPARAAALLAAALAVHAGACAQATLPAGAVPAARVVSARPALAPLRIKLPYPEGTAHVVYQGNEGAFTHSGLNRFAWDFGLPENSPVCASAQGRVVRVKQDSDNGGTSERDFDHANTVVLDHGNGYFTQYLHLKKSSARVKEGDIVYGGQAIALSGNTGFSSTPHLHFQVQDVTGQSLPCSFLDVPGDGIPHEGGRYVSGNDGMGMSPYAGESKMPLNIFMGNRIELLTSDLPAHLLRTDRTYRLEGVARRKTGRVVLYLMGPAGGRPLATFPAPVGGDGRFSLEVRLSDIRVKIDGWSDSPSQSNLFALAMTHCEDDGSFWSGFSVPVTVR